MNFFKDINVILGRKFTIVFYSILLLSIITSFFDVLSIGSVGLLIGIILKPDFLNNYSNIIFVDEFLALDHVNQIYVSCITIVALFIFKSIFIFLVFFSQGKFTYKLKKNLSTKIFNSYLNKEYLFHLENNPAVLWRNINEEVDYTSQYLDLFSKLFGAILTVLILFILIIYTSPILYFSLSVFIVISLLIVTFYLLLKSNISKRGEIRLKAASNLLKNVEQALSSIKETILYNRINLFINKFKDLVELKGRQGFIINIINYLPRVFIELVAIIVITSVVFFYTYKNYDINELLAFLSFFTLSLIRLIPSFNLISMCITSMRYVKNSKNIILKEIKDFKNYNFKIKDQENNSLDFVDEIELKNINFKYNITKSFFLEDINLKIKKGEKIAIVGPSGSGKSTLINIFTGLLKPNSGEILVDKKSIFENLKSWRLKIGYIPQDIYLLDDSIKKNITFSNDEKPKDENYFKEVVKVTELEEFINDLPNKFETLVGHKGVRISGGQRQRLAMARALYRKAEIILMDEPTSALDLNTRENLLNNFFETYKNITLIMISHDIKNFENKFDKIIKINNGKIIK